MYMCVEKESTIKGHAILTDLNFNVIYMERTRTRCLILAIMSHYMYLKKKNRSYDDVKEKIASFCIVYELLVINTRYL